MSAHVLYPAIDPDYPATTSRTVIETIVRDRIGFDGLLMSDDLSMKALGGSFADRTRASLEAGCDLVLHCNGEMAEMVGVVSAAGDLDGISARRAKAALARLPRQVEPLDIAAARARFDEALSGVWAS
jgi:beta-N-acetylhexosaminidase